MELLTWQQVDSLVTGLGSERWLKGPSGRVATERKGRGWSQETLAEKLASVGCYMHQSAISKIEAPAGARGIALDELLALSKVFEIPLGELLLPPGSMDMVRGLRDLAAGPAAARRAHLAKREYDELLARVLTFGDDNRTAVSDHLDAIIARHQGDPDPCDSFEYQFAIDVLAKHQEKK